MESIAHSAFGFMSGLYVPSLPFKNLKVLVLDCPDPDTAVRQVPTPSVSRGMARTTDSEGEVTAKYGTRRDARQILYPTTKVMNVF